MFRRYPRIPKPHVDVGEIVPGLYQRSLHSTSVFVVDNSPDADPPGVSLIDSGLRIHHRGILEFLGSMGHAPGSIRHLIATHQHLDHIGGMHGIQQATGLPVRAHQLDAAGLRQESPGDLPNPVQQWWLRAMLWPVMSRMRPSPIPNVAHLAEGDTFPLLSGARIIHTPGHTPGSISIHFPEEGVLIVADAMQRKGNRVTLPSPFFSSDLETARESVQKIATLDFDILCFSHFLPMRRGARAAVRSLAEYLD